MILQSARYLDRLVRYLVNAGMRRLVSEGLGESIANLNPFHWLFVHAFL